MLSAVWHISLALLVLYGVVFFFVMMGSQTFFSGRTIIQNVPGTAAVVTVLILLALGWKLLWGKFAWPAFFGMLIILFIAISTMISISEERKKRNDRNLKE